ncbi:unnamed protein product [Brassica rapa]|uniref:S-protein homolog n=2 Tax=Brassica TaxID=3705 RepID=A0A8D9GZF7_BRACM|nr:unnamed protein product [Brassica napus]CAG7890009.1 unnamed protein product [Brassica rapa]
MDSLIQLIVIFMVTMFISASISQAQRTTTVVIHNDLEGGLSLGYHCKSGDDLGYKSLAPGGSGSFSFKPDIFGRTETENLKSLDAHNANGG